MIGDLFQYGLGCMNCYPDPKQVQENVSTILGERVKKSLESNKQSRYDSPGSSSTIFLACDTKTGVIFPYTEVISFTKDPNLALIFSRTTESELPVYWLYSTQSCSKQAINTFVETEKALNRLSDKMWKGTLREKVKNIKRKYGLIEAIKWNYSYRDADLGVELPRMGDVLRMKAAQY